ncbi:MAG: xanthine dehydrogenase family protein molybdopterin-binding subunit [Dehalococcoidales bacterium]
MSTRQRDDWWTVGKRLPLIDGPTKARGEAEYAGDLSLPRLLWGKILRSPYPHARLVHVDAGRARRLPGVKAVITGKDIPRVIYGIVPKAADEYALALDKVLYVGDEVAAVAAIDEERAEEALDKIEVEYEQLPAVFDPEDARAPGAPLIHQAPNNISFQVRKEFGDVINGFGQAEHVRHDRFVTQAQAHCPLEPHAVVASFDSASSRLTVWSAKQIPFFLRKILAKTLQLPEAKVRVIKPHLGGGFGGKVDMFSLDFCAAELSRRTGRPVKIVYTREESLTATRHRHPMVVEVKTGVKRDGTLLAQHYRVVADGGAYNSTAPVMLSLAAFFVMLPYRVPNLLLEGYHVYTNKPAGGPMRGHGVPQMRFAFESQMDMIAEDLGLDPVEIRLINAIKEGEEHPAKLTIRTCGFSESIGKAARALNWQEQRKKKVTDRGVGLGCSGFFCGVNNLRHLGSGAVVKIEEDGAVTLLTGAADVGQGSNTVLAQIAAEELGVYLDDVRLTAADTELTPLDPGTFGSGVTFRAGNAVRLAAKSAKNKILEPAAAELEASPDDLLFREGRIFVKGSPERGLTLGEAVKACRYAGKPTPIIGRGFYHPPAKEAYTLLTELGDISAAYSFSTQGAEVEVEPETGMVKVLKLVSVHDGGTLINPLLVEGQLDGSMVMGMGQALGETFIWERGQALNPNLLDYRLATSMDIPALDMVEIDIYDSEGPFGAKEAGEGTTVGIAPAIANAIYHATGVRITQLPITREGFLKSLEKKEV